MRIRLLTAILLLTAFMTVSVCVAAEKGKIDYPKRTIDMVVPYAPGGGADIVAREFAKQSDFRMRIVNVPGAGGAKGAIQSFLDEPDGYNIIIHVSRYYAFCDVMGIIKLPGFSWDKMVYLGAPVRDDVVFTVLKDSPIQDWDSFIQEGKKREVKVAGIGAHGTARYVTDQIAKNYGLKLVYVAEDSGMDTRTALLGKHIDVRWSQMSENKDLIDAGDVKVIATWGSERSVHAPNAPTITELGIKNLAEKDFTVDAMVRGFFAPPGTPEEIVKILEKEIERVSKLPEFKKYVESQGYTASFYSSENMKTYAKGWSTRYLEVKQYFEQLKKKGL